MEGGTGVTLRKKKVLADSLLAAVEIIIVEGTAR